MHLIPFGTRGARRKAIFGIWIPSQAVVLTRVFVCFLSAPIFLGSLNATL